MNWRTLGLVALGLAIAAGLIWVAIVLFGFWAGFVFLTLAYLALAAGIIVLLARIWDYDPAEIAENNNTWFFTALGMAVITSVTAWFVWGPPLLLPSDWPEAETLTKAKDVGNHILFGNTAKPVEPVKALPWLGGTWFFWKAAFLYWLLTVVLIPICFWDEFQAGIRGLREGRERRRQEAAQAAATAAAAQQRRGRRGGQQQPVPPPQQLPFNMRRFLWAEMFMDFVANFTAEYAARRAGDGFRR